MAPERLPKSEPREICPVNSRYSIRWSGDRKEGFTIHRPGNRDILFRLDYEEGRNVYEALRGQKRIEETGKPKRGRIPTIEGEQIFSGKEIFTRTIHAGEPRSPRLKMDFKPRQANLEQQCFDATRRFMQESRLRLEPTDIENAQIQDYASLARAVAGYGFPVHVRLDAWRPLLAEGSEVAAEEKGPVHEFIALGGEGEDIVCFEKLGEAFPWRLVPLKEIFEMYEQDYKRAYEGRAQLFWNIGKLTKDLT